MQEVRLCLISLWLGWGVGVEAEVILDLLLIS